MNKGQCTLFDCSSRTEPVSDQLDDEDSDSVVKMLKLKRLSKLLLWRLTELVHKLFRRYKSVKVHISFELRLCLFEVIQRVELKHFDVKSGHVLEIDHYFDSLINFEVVSVSICKLNQDLLRQHACIDTGCIAFRYFFAVKKIVLDSQSFDPVWIEVVAEALPVAILMIEVIQLLSVKAVIVKART